MPTNTAAWQTTTAQPLSIEPAPYTPPQSHEIVIKSHAWAINPADWLVQQTAYIPWLKYPLISGTDIAGEVFEIGSSVTRFKVGDRVLGLANGLTFNKASGGGFQLYIIIEEELAAPIPTGMTFAEGAVFPLALSTAACGLFQRDQLALEYPRVVPELTGKTVVVWGGASALGCNGVQLAVAAGYEVFATASPRNFDYVKSLGASRCFDYNSKTVVEELVAALKDRDFVGMFHAAGGAEPCFEVVYKVDGKKFVATALGVPENKPSGVDGKMIWGSSLKDDEVGPAIFVDFLPKALEQGKYVVAPEPWIVGKGLESIQVGLEAQQKGVSAKKVAVTV